MGTRGICSICSRPDADAIDHELATSGTSWRSVARRFGLSRSATNRHAHQHLGSRLKRAAETRAKGADPSLLDKLAELNRLARGVLAKAYNAGELSVAVSAIGEARKQLELEGRLLGQLREAGGTVVNINFNLSPEQGVSIATMYLYRHGLPPSGAIDTTATAQASPPLPDVPGAREPQEPAIREAPAEKLSPAMERWHRQHREAK